MVRIKEYSGGLPIILEPWLKTSTDLNYHEINRDNHCQQLLNLRRGLSDEDQTRLSKLSIMLYPARDEFIAKDYLEFPNIGIFHPFNTRMEDKGIFERVSENISWFKHELIKYCFENALYTDEKKEYNKILVKYFAGLKKNLSVNVGQVLDQNRYKIDISYCYHLHNAGLYAESFKQNRELANFAASIGDLDIAERSYRNALYAGSQETSIPKNERMECLYFFTRDVLHTWGRYDEALKNYSEVGNYFLRADNRQGVASTLNNMGGIYFFRGENDEAIKRYKASLKISRKLGDRKGIANALNNMGGIYYAKAKYAQAIKSYKESLAIFREISDRRGMAETLNNIGLIHFIRERYDEALSRYEESLSIYREIGGEGMPNVLNNIGLIHFNKGRYDEALSRYEESLEISRKLGDQKGIADTLHTIGNTHHRKGQYNEATNKYEDSLRIYMKIGDANGIANAIHGLGQVHYEKDQYDEALSRYEESLEIYRKIGEPKSIAITLYNIGLANSKKAEYGEAITRYEESLAIFRKIGTKKQIGTIEELIDKLKEKL